MNNGQNLRWKTTDSGTLTFSGFQLFSTAAMKLFARLKELFEEAAAAESLISS